MVLSLSAVLLLIALVFTVGAASNRTALWPAVLCLILVALLALGWPR